MTRLDLDVIISRDEARVSGGDIVKGVVVAAKKVVLGVQKVASVGVSEVEARDRICIPDRVYLFFRRSKLIPKTLFQCSGLVCSRRVIMCICCQLDQHWIFNRSRRFRYASAQLISWFECF